MMKHHITSVLYSNNGADLSPLIAITVTYCEPEMFIIMGVYVMAVNVTKNECRR